MIATDRRLRHVALVLVVCLASASLAQAPIDDPLPDEVVKGDIVVAAIPFVRAPQTFDAATPQGTNNPRTRIQYLQAVPGIPDRLAFNDIRGVLYLTDTEARTPTVYLDLRDQGLGLYGGALPNESGFMGFAFHPEFADTGKSGYGKFYTAFTATRESGEPDYADESNLTQVSVVREWTATAPTARAFDGTSREVLRVGEFAANHNVGTVAFNPTATEGDADYGLLYIGFGDGGSAHDPRDYGQGRAEPLGAIARIDPLDTADGASYGIPDDNPFVDEEAVAPEIWAYGLRHPQQFSWDSDGRMFIGDIGQDQIEEVNLGAAGANYGWRLREGTFATGHAVNRASGPAYPRPETDPTSFVYPIAQYDHDEGFAIGGGFVYRGAAIPALVGKYVFTDFPRGRLFAIDADNLPEDGQAPIEELRIAFDGSERDLVDEAGFPNTYRPGSERVDARVSVDAAGELYLLTKGDGWIRRLLPNGFDDLTPFPGRNTGDFNGDGADDLLLRHRDGRWTYYPMNGRANIAAQRGSATLPADRAWRFSGVGDFDGDDRDDVLLRHADGRWRYYPMDGRRAQGADRGAPSLDAVPGVADRGSWRLQRRWSGRRSRAPCRWRLALLRARRCRDRRRRVRSSADHRSARLAACRRRRLQRQRPTRRPAPPHRQRQLDLLPDERSPPGCTSGRGFANLTKALAWQPVAIGDFNGDGRDDVIVRHTNGQWHYYPMRGRRTIAGRGRVSLPSNLDWQVAAVGDFNGDGPDDLMLRHVNGSWAYYPLNGREIIAGQQGTASVTRNLDWSLP